MELRQKFPKTTGASTHTFKNHGCYSTHSTHTNKGTVSVLSSYCFKSVTCMKKNTAFSKIFALNSLLKYINTVIVEHNIVRG